jgi:hypothetical protein
MFVDIGYRPCISVFRSEALMKIKGIAGVAGPTHVSAQPEAEITRLLQSGKKL